MIVPIDFGDHPRFPVTVRRGDTADDEEEERCGGAPCLPQEVRASPKVFSHLSLPTTLSRTQRHARTSCDILVRYREEFTRPIQEADEFLRSLKVHLRSRSLQCIVFWQSVADELAVVAAPLLERVILWSSSCSCRSVDHRMRIKISRASVLQVVGYLNPSFHQLQIGDTVMKPGIKASPEVAVPSVKILALSVRFGVAEEARMVPCFLRCFPNTETLHLMSVQDHGPTTEHSNFEFWKEIDSIQCVKSSIKKVVLHDFRWENCEIEFLTSIMERGQVLQIIFIFQAQYGCVPEGEINGKLSLLASLNWGGALMISSSQKNISRYDIATDLSRNDPFDCQS